MRTFKINNYRLDHWSNLFTSLPNDNGVGRHWGYVHHSISIGMRVCPLNGMKSVGIITDVEVETPTGFHPDKMESKHVTVRWTRGPNKGKTEVKEPRHLANFEAYKQAVTEHLNELNDIEAEATMG